jgi:DNA-directed RNA polymerase specialized sigma24 family protein
MTHARQAEFNTERESELLKRMAANDRLALCLLYDAYLPRLIGLFRHVVAANDSSLVGQLVEETMMGVWLKRESLAESDSPHVSIMSQAVAHARRRLEKQRRVSTPRERTPMLSMLAALSVDERAVMHFVYTGHSREQVAALLGGSCEGVDALLSSARTCMRRGFARRRKII